MSHQQINPSSIEKRRNTSDQSIRFGLAEVGELRALTCSAPAYRMHVSYTKSALALVGSPSI